MKASLAGLALLAVAISCLYFNHFNDFYTPDSATYIAPAASLLAGHGFTDADGNPETIRTPAYPLLILPFLWAHLDMQWLVLFQHLLRILLILGTILFALRLTGGRVQALLAGVLLCIDIPFVEAANHVLTETLFTSVLSILFLLLWLESRKSKLSVFPFILAGLLLGALVMVRPIALYFWLPISVFLLFLRKPGRIVAVAAFLISFSCIPLLWGVHNYHQTGYFTISSISGYNILQYRAAGVLALNDPGHFHDNAEKHKDELTEQACHDAKHLTGRSCKEMSEEEKSRYFTQYGSRILFRHPLGSLKLTARGAATNMLEGSPAFLSESTGMEFHRAVKVTLIYTVPMFCFAIFGLWMFHRVDRYFFWFALLTCCYFIGISAGAESDARFRVPIMPIYSILVAHGINSVFRRIEARKSATRLN